MSTSVTCPYCGADGQEYQFNCTKCGKDLPREQRITPTYSAKTAAAPPADTAAGETPPSQAPSAEVNACPICGRPKSIYADKCTYCSQPETNYADESYSEPYYSSESELPKIAGILIIIAGVLGIFNGLLYFAADTGYGVPAPVTCCAGLMVLFGFIAIAGGFSTMGRGNAVFAIVGGVFGILCIGFFIGALMGLIGLILVAVSYKEFS